MNLQQSSYRVEETINTLYYHTMIKLTGILIQRKPLLSMRNKIKIGGTETNCFDIKPLGMYIFIYKTTLSGSKQDICTVNKFIFNYYTTNHKNLNNKNKHNIPCFHKHLYK